MTDYSELSALSSVYLEDSYVLDIVEEPGVLKFKLEVVLTESHPAYQSPKPGEQYWYANGWLVFTDVSRTDWESRSFQRSTDAAGDEDLGNLDFLKREGDHWLVGGDWGQVRVYTPAAPQLVLDQPCESEPPRV